MTDRAPEDLAEWAALYREARAPSESLRVSVETQLHKQRDTAHPNAGWQWGLGLAAGGLIGAAALLALTCSLSALRGRTAAGDSPDIAPMQQVPASGQKVEPPRPASQNLAPALLEHPDPPPAEAAAAPSPEPAVRAKRRTPPTASEPGPRQDDLESLAALRDAERTLRHNPVRARQLLEQHAKDYPESKLWLEREALWIRAACRSGAADGLETRRASFSRRADVGAYRAAIQRDCEVE